MSSILAYQSTYLTDNPDELLHQLIYSHTTTLPTCLKVVWDLGEFAHHILSLLPDTVRIELSRPPHRSKWGNYRLYYISGKVFSINKNGSEVSFYDLSQYYPDSPAPRSLPELQDKADRLLRALVDLGIPDPKSLSSPVAAFKGHKLLGGIQDTTPTVFDAPESVLEAYETALWCTPREWVSNYQVGHFPNLHTVDISSAYPWHASRLLHLGDCSFRKSAEMDETAYYGFLVGDFTVYPDHPLAFCSPFLADRGDGVLVNFVGTARNYPCLLDDVRTLYRYNMGEFKLKQGWFISPMNGVRPRLPFQSLMGDLYKQRGSTELKSYLLKRVMNGVIGKLLETRKDDEGNIIEYGELYNPIYHALCTTRTRLQVFEFLAQHGITREELVFVGVDGVKITRCISFLGQSPSGMGRWRYAGSEPAFVLSPGAVLTLSRNFKQTGYADLWCECMARPNAYKLGKGVDSVIDLRKLFLNQTRSFSKLPSTGKSLLEGEYLSEPVELG